MKSPLLTAVSAIALLAACTFSSTASADEAKTGLKSGPQKGDQIGAFYVTKLCGAEDDGVKEGKNLCYRCRNGGRPQVMVFTRSADAKVAKLIEQLDAAVAKNEDKELRVFVNFMGDDKDDVTDAAKKFAKVSKAKNVPFVIPNEFENGPDNYGINSKAEVTVVMASDMSVKANHAVAKVDELNVQSVVADLKKILE